MPPRWPKLPPGVRRLFRLPKSRDRLLCDLDEEIEVHLAMRVEDLRRLGMSEADAEAEARRRFGNAEAYRDYAARRAGTRARRLMTARWLAECAQDVRVALRQFRQAPTLGAVVVLTLALCIGATTAAYSVVRHLLLAPLPYPDGNRIVRLEMKRAEEGGLHADMSVELFLMYMARSRTLEDFAAINSRRAPVGRGEGGAQDSAWVGRVSPSLLPMLRVRPALGRGFTRDDGRRGAPAVALLSDSVWRSRFGGDPGIIGRAITVDGLPHSIVGVVPRDAGVPTQYRSPLDVWLPLDLDSATSLDYAVARLRPGFTSAAASRELQAIRGTLPDTGWLKGRHAEVRTAQEQVPPPQRQALVVLFAAASGLLLVACADVSGLLLMRGWARRREFAIRRALGAWRGRLARQLLTESLLVAVPGGVLGLLVAWLGLRVAVAVRPGGIEFLDAVRIDGAAILWTAAVAVATALLFGVWPVIYAWVRSLEGALRAGGAGAGQGRAAGSAHATLVVGQIALSLMFVTAAGVAARSFVALALTPVGYEPEGLVGVTVQPVPTPVRPLTPAERAAATRALHETLAATPGVSDVAVGMLPLTNAGPGPIEVEGPAGVRPSPTILLTGFTYASPEYFRVARIPLVRGRVFDDDPAVAAGEVIISETLARQLWPGGDEPGARLRDGFGKWLTVVGITGDVQMPGSASEFFNLQMYRPSGVAPSSAAGSFVLRTRSDPAALRPLLAQAVERAGVGVTLHDVVAAESTLEYAFAAPRFAVVLFGAFGLLAVALAAVGLFGIVAFAVARRTREIGVRMALGAAPGVVGRLILGGGLRLTIVGCALGLLGVYSGKRTLSAFLYGVSAPDTTLLISAVLLLIAIALVASFVPMRRALRIDPTTALRTE
jgi:putative ABC transport system permease protein